ncbi:MAG: TatD family hydrolase [Vicinamibacterales bacterium]
MIDSHCHLAGPEFAADLADVLARAKEAGVARLLVILAAEDHEEMSRAEAVLNAWPDARFAVGVHPHQAHVHASHPDRVVALVERGLAALPGARAIGEIGLDYHYNFSPPVVQRAVFRAQLRLARERKLPVVLHVRDAEDDTLRILEEEHSAAGLRGVFHCFTGDCAAADRALATGFYLSIPGIITFPRAGSLRETAAHIPEARLLIETDSPYLAPIPHRGMRNEPAFVARTLDAVAQAKGVDRNALARTLVANFDRLFEAAI